MRDTPSVPSQKYVANSGEPCARLARRYDDEYGQYSEEKQRRQRRVGPAQLVTYF